ncbi:hypothetical protein B0H15DRAFT_850579 [Mycena belliarum]|uniref:polynucleotide adenylyltransferase n=1 Tax=Mycena belliarum TaxID=1033014 RepID=A0AAD6TZ31_9AGAR|nr:hypothetical protein B0H15DRAFT_850579 [Mycena belliae]
MDQTRDARDRGKPTDAPEARFPSNAHNLPSRPPREKRKRSPAPVAPEDQPILTPWLSLLPNTSPTSTDQRLHQEIVAYVEYVQPTPQERTARQKLLDAIRKALLRRFPDGELKLFGSAATGLCLPTGDMDIAILTSEVIPAAEKKRPLFQMSSILKAARLTWDVQVNHRARVPILTFKSLPEYGSFSVDIGINNQDGPRAIEVVNGYLDQMPALRPLILIVKGFLSQRNLNSAAYGGLGSYVVICMCISFLQLNPSKRPQEYIDKPVESESLGALLADFMFYYGIEFPYATSYISVQEGKLLPKSSAHWITNKTPDALSIQCLVNPDSDIGKSAGRLEAIRGAFKAGYASILKLSLADESLLGPLVALSQRTLDHRAQIAHLVDTAPGQPPKQKSQQPPQRPRVQQQYQPQPQHQLPARPMSTHTHTQARLPARPPPLPALPAPEPVPYGMAFGAGSAMGRGVGSPFGAGSAMSRGGGVNRKGSGFAPPSAGVYPNMHMGYPNMYMGYPNVPMLQYHDSEWPPRGGAPKRGGGGGGRKRMKMDGR